MKKVWIVVANSSEAKIYRAENTHVLVQHAIAFHDAAHLPARELVSDSYGRETNTQTRGGDTYEQRTPVKLKEALLFADEIAALLDKGQKSGEFEKLYLVAKPPFLGHIHQSLTPNVAKLIQSEIHKDLTHAKPEEIREYLPPVL